MPSVAAGYAIAFLFTYTSFVHAATTHIVKVGLEGSFFDPPTLSAGLNDTVTFVFAGLIHTVTQSSLSNPCLPLPGGFSSGVGGTLITNNQQDFQTWNLQITNISAPIWFFCQITTPTSHCASGMVGVINPPSIAIYDQWLASAKLVSNTPSPVITPVLTGIGAFATKTPTITTTAPPDSSTSMPASSSPTDGPTSTVSSSGSPTPVQDSQSKSSTTSHIGAVVGGAVGGAVVLLLLVISLLWCRRKSRTATSPVDSAFFRYNAAPVVRRPSEAFVEAKRLEEKLASVSSTTSAPHRPFSPIRRGPADSTFGPPGVVSPRPQQFSENVNAFRAGNMDQNHAGGYNSPLSPSTDVGHGMAMPNNIDVHALATEVATLLRVPSANTLGASTNLSSTNSTQNHSTTTAPLRPPEGPRPLKSPAVQGAGVTRTESPSGPPAYRTAMGTPDRGR